MVPSLIMGCVGTPGTVAAAPERAYPADAAPVRSARRMTEAICFMN